MLGLNSDHINYYRLILVSPNLLRTAREILKLSLQLGSGAKQDSNSSLQLHEQPRRRLELVAQLRVSRMTDQKG